MVLKVRAANVSQMVRDVSLPKNTIQYILHSDFKFQASENNFECFFTLAIDLVRISMFFKFQVSENNFDCLH